MIVQYSSSPFSQGNWRQVRHTSQLRSLVSSACSLIPLRTKWPNCAVPRLYYLACKYDVLVSSCLSSSVMSAINTGTTVVACSSNILRAIMSQLVHRCLSPLSHFVHAGVPLPFSSHKWRNAHGCKHRYEQKWSRRRGQAGVY